MNKKQKIAAVLSLVTAFIILIGVYFIFGAKADNGNKDITLIVTNSAGKSVKYDVSTDGEFLIDAMEDAKKDGLTYSGENGTYGFTVYEINGEKTDFNSSYWSILINGEYGQYGVDSQPIEDGSEYSLVYTKL